jgi:hypothetical protein
MAGDESSSFLRCRVELGQTFSYVCANLWAEGREVNSVCTVGIRLYLLLYLAVKSLWGEIYSQRLYVQTCMPDMVALLHECSEPEVVCSAYKQQSSV